MVTKALYWRLMEEYDKPESKSLIKVRDVNEQSVQNTDQDVHEWFKIDKDALLRCEKDFEEELVAIERRLQEQVRETNG